MPENNSKAASNNDLLDLIKLVFGSGGLIGVVVLVYLGLCKAGKIENFCLPACHVQTTGIIVTTQRYGEKLYTLTNKNDKKVTTNIYLQPGDRAKFQVKSYGTNPPSTAECNFFWNHAPQEDGLNTIPNYYPNQRSNSIELGFDNPGSYLIGVDITSGACKEEIIQIPVYVTPAIISRPATRVIINPEQESIQSENYPSSSQSEDLFNLARSEAEISDVKIEITSPANGSIVAQSSPVTGSIYGLNWPLRAFLVVSEISASSGKGLWWTTEISPDSNSWSAPSAQFGDERPDGGTARFEVFVVLTKDPATIDALKFRYYALENLQEKHRDELDLEVRGPVITVSRQ
jgi:hypothetical protein